MTSNEINLADLDGTNGFKIGGELVSDNAGQSVSSAGDINGDGFDDVIIGAPATDISAGTSYVVFGKGGGFDADLDLTTLVRR